MDEKRGSMASPILSSSFSRRSRLFSIRRLFLAITLTGVIFYFYPTIFSALPVHSASLGRTPSQPQGTEPESAPLYPPSPEQKSPIRPTETGASRDTGAQIDAAKNVSPSTSSSSKTSTSKKISLEAHLMSKCPDARDCLRDLVVPAMSQIDSLVDFKLYYIGSVGADNTVTCKHGPGECLGNSISLCAQELYGGSNSNNKHNNSTSSAKTSLGFTNCLLQDYKHVPDKSLIQDCALEHGVDFEALNQCVSENGRGEDLLRKSVEESKSKGVKYSCTVRLQDSVWCVRDGGKWKECGSHGGSVEALVGEVQRISGEVKGREREM